VAKLTQIATEPEVRVPSLDSGSPGAPRRGGEPEAARPLPRTATVCLSHSARQCWSEPGETTCTTGPSRGGEGFRVGIDDPARTDVQGALADCQAELAR